MCHPRRVDIDALVATRTSDWERLRLLTRTRRLHAEDIDELSHLYRRVTSDLALLKAGDTAQPDPDLAAVLSRDLAAARARLTPTSGASLASFAHWWRATLPAALHRIRWWSIGVAVLFTLIAVVRAARLLHDPTLLSTLGSPSELETYARNEFVAYYSQDTPSEFASSVWFNNAFIALQCVGGGITGIYPAWVLLMNAEQVGTAAGIVTHVAGAWHFLRFILPHGIPELTAVIISGAAGMRVCWSLLVPGALPRVQAVARTGRTMVTVALGMVALLFLSGLIEGFVTPSELPSAVKVGIGALLTVGVWVLTFVVGARARSDGEDGDLIDDRPAERDWAG